MDPMLLFPFLSGDTLLFTAGMIAAHATTPVDIWVLTPFTAAGDTMLRRRRGADAGASVD
jgi:membrane protein DedA with SNARE-associated domain